MSQRSKQQEHDLKKTWVRWLMLLMTCFFLLGSYFCYDSPGPLQTQLMQQFHINSTKFSLLYTVYSIPNVILPIFGGIFLDRIGIRAGLVLFTFILTLGQFVYMIGGFQNNFTLLLTGRIIFGMGGECMGVTQAAFVSSWFKGAELSLALALNLSISRLGSVANAAILPTVYEKYGLGPALLLGFGVCCFSLLNACGLVCLDRAAAKKSENEEEKQKEEPFSFSDIKDLSVSYWLLTASTMVTYMSIFPYIMIASDTLQTKYHFDKVQAGYIFGTPYIISACLSPFFGYLTDKIGKRAFFICLSSVVFMMTFTSSMLAPECDRCYNEVFPLALTGIGYAMQLSAVWGSIPYVVQPKATGTAFGITVSIGNMGLIIAPTLLGFIREKTKIYDHGFFWVHAFFLFVTFIGLNLNATLYYIDIIYNNGVLDKVKTNKEAKKEQPDYVPTEQSDPLTATTKPNSLK